jgi:hypothetical protein
MTSSQSSTSCDVERAKLAETQEEECVERKTDIAIILCSPFKLFAQTDGIGLLSDNGLSYLLFYSSIRLTR